MCDGTPWSAIPGALELTLMELILTALGAIFIAGSFAVLMVAALEPLFRGSDR